MKFGLPTPFLSIISLLLASPAQVLGQDWETFRFKTNSAWNLANSLEGQRSIDPPELRWSGNDPYDETTGRGSVSYLTFLNGYTDAASGFRNPHRSLIFGGAANLDPANLQKPGGSLILPGVRNPTLFRSFVPREVRTNDQVRLAVEFAVVDSMPDSGLWMTNWPDRDAFAFELKNGVAGESLAKFMFRPEALVQSGTTNQVLGFYWQRNGQDQMPGTNSGLTAPWAIGYGVLHRLEVLLAGDRMDVSLSVLTPAGPNGQVASTTAFINQGRLSGSNTVANFNTFALVWELSNTNLPPVPGYNYIAVQDISVTSGANTWLKMGNVPVGTSLTNDHDGNGYSLLQEYAHGAASPGAAFTPPAIRIVGPPDNAFLELSAPIRTNDWRLSPAVFAADRVTNFASAVPLQYVRGTNAVPGGMEERIFTLPATGKTSGFMRLRFDLAP